MTKLDIQSKQVTSCVIKVIPKNGDEEALANVTPLIKSTIDTFEGTLMNEDPKNMHAIFGAPLFYESHALHACLAAYSILKQIKQSKLPVEVQIGINTGEVALSEEEQDGVLRYHVEGSSVTLVQQMLRASNADQILLSEESYRFVDKYIEAQPAVDKAIEGVTTYLLTGIKHEAIHIELEDEFFQKTRFFGRAEELKLFSVALTQAKQKYGTILAFKAEAGMGKTRLMYEFTRIARENSVKVITASSSPYEGKNSFSTLRMFVKNLFSVSSSMIDPAYLEELVDYLKKLPFTEKFAADSIITILGGNTEEIGWVGLSPNLQQQILFKSIIEYLDFQSEKAPIVVIFEDLHWCDVDTLRFLNELATALSQRRILLLLCYRVEFNLSKEILKFGEEVRLTPLTLDSSKQLLLQLLPGGGELRELREQILTLSAGNPFHLEEYVQSIISKGYVTPTDKGYVLSEDFNIDILPKTLGSTISSRILELSISDKTLLQQASVIGNIFPVSFLRYISDASVESFNGSLINLEQHGFIREIEIFPEPIYSFKHITIQDVANNTILKSSKLRYHRRLVEGIEFHHAEDLSQFYSILSHHAYMGGLWKKALKYFNLLMPDQNSIDFPTIQYLEIGPKVSECYQMLSNEEEKVEIFDAYCRSILLWLHALLLSGQIEQGLEETTNLIRDSVNSNNRLYELVARAWDVVFYAVSGRARTAYVKMHEVLSRLDELNIPNQEGVEGAIHDSITFIAAHPLLKMGKYKEFDEMIKPILDRSYSFSFVHYSCGIPIKAAAYANWFWCNSQRVYVAPLQSKLPYLEKEVESLPEAEPRVLAQMCLVTYQFLKGDFNETVNQLRTVIPSAASIQQAFIEAYLLAFASVAYYYKGDSKKALSYARDAFVKYKRINYTHTSFNAPLLAEVFSYCGAYDEAISILEDLLVVAESDDEKPLLANCYRVKAMTYNLMTRHTRPDKEIEELLSKAKEITEEVGCNLQRPFIYLNYAEYYKRLGKTQEALEHYIEALKYFKEYEMTGWYEYFQANEQLFLK